MARLFQRSCRVLVDSLLIEGLRVQFKVVKTLTPAPNTCECAITNLNEAHRAAMQRKGVKISLEAGYTGATALIFVGDARTIDHTHVGAEWVTKIQSGDGERAYGSKRISMSFKPGTAIHTVASTALQLMQGFNPEDLDVTDAIKKVQENLTGQFVHGYTAHGKASQELDTLLAGRGLEWSIQDGRVQILPTGQPVAGQTILLNSDTGLVGSPEHGTPDKQAAALGRPPVLKVKSLLQPSFRPGGRVRIEARGMPKGGNFRIQKVTHAGDTHSKDWYSDLECTPL